MSKRLFLESNQAFNEEKPFQHNIKKKESSYKGASRLLFFRNTHTLKAPLSSSAYIPITPSRLYTLTFTTRVPAQDLSFFSFSIFPSIVPAVLLAPAGGRCFFLFLQTRETRCEYSKVSSSSSCTDALTHTDSFPTVEQTEARRSLS